MYVADIQKKCIMHFVLLFYTRLSIYKMILLCHPLGEQIIHIYLYDAFRYVYTFESSRTDEKIVTNSDVHKYFSHTYKNMCIPVWCRINERGKSADHNTDIHTHTTYTQNIYRT